MAASTEIGGIYVPILLSKILTGAQGIFSSPGKSAHSPSLWSLSSHQYLSPISAPCLACTDAGVLSFVVPNSETSLFMPPTRQALQRLGQAALHLLIFFKLTYLSFLVTFNSFFALF